MPSVEYYVSLLEDRDRIATVLKAIARTVRPGDVVVEVGCGIGTYALAALRAGAGHVTAIDANPAALAFARELGVAREGGERLTLIEASAEAVELPRRADVVIFEDYGGLGHSPGLRTLLDHVRERLAAPGARYLPAAVDLVLAPTDAPLRTIGPADAPALPFSADALALLRKRSMNDPFAPELDAAALLAEGQVVGRLEPSLGIVRRTPMGAGATASRSGQVTGLIGWIRLDFGGGLLVDNVPAIPTPTYPALAFPFEESLPVGEGERLELTLEAIHGPGPKTLLWQWGVTAEQGSRNGSSINGLPGDLGLLTRGSVQEVPRTTRLLPAVAEVCRQIDNSKTSGEIAHTVYSLYKGEFRDEKAAEAFVLDLLERLRGTTPP
ncbi:MAG TPA: class I SAM-dependent methyltransferase [Planctomycetota bacterium]|nr:class I SAM-dependent methyltransferase [Planctomycetota bacterium]